MDVEKRIRAVFGPEVFERSMEINRSGRFTDQQVQKIDSACRQMLAAAAEDDGSGREFVKQLDHQTACLLAAWVLRGGNRSVPH